MIELPDFTKSFEYENNFYLSCDISRISKFFAHYEFFKMTMDLPGALVECGVFKGVSLMRFAMFKDILGNRKSRKIIGFDSFSTFPQTNYEPDKSVREKFISEAGDKSISIPQLENLLSRKGIQEGVELIPGDITESVPAYFKKHPELRISLLNLDTDLYEPAVTILENFYPRIVKGGLLIIDDYGVFPGETKATDDYFAGTDVRIRKLPYCTTPCYVIKE